MSSVFFVDLYVHRRERKKEVYEDSTRMSKREKEGERERSKYLVRRDKSVYEDSSRMKEREKEKKKGGGGRNGERENENEKRFAEREMF
jgi:hypothetical protein